MVDRPDRYRTRAGTSAFTVSAGSDAGTAVADYTLDVGSAPGVRSTPAPDGPGPSPAGSGRPAALAATGSGDLPRRLRLSTALVTLGAGTLAATRRRRRA